MATVDVALEVGDARRSRRSRGERGNGLVRLDDGAANARSEGARFAADLRPQFHPASGDRAGRLGRHQRAAVERQRFDLAERERRADHQQQLRLQRRRRHQPALLQQPRHRVERDDRRTAAGRCRATSRRRPRRCRKSSCRRACTTPAPAATAAATSRWSRRAAPTAFRGTVYYYNQNDALMANDFFFNRAGIDKPILEPARRRRHASAVRSSGTRRSSSVPTSARRPRPPSWTRRATPCSLPRALTDDRSDAGINSFARGHLEPDTRSGQFQRDQPDLAGAAEGAVSRRHLPGPLRGQRHQLRAERHATVRELPGRLRHSGDVRAGSVHDERGSSADARPTG